MDQIAKGEANVAFLMNPVTMNQLREVAFAGDVMPQKSTDFFPKLLSGLTIYALDDVGGLTGKFAGLTANSGKEAIRGGV